MKRRIFYRIIFSLFFLISLLSVFSWFQGGSKVLYPIFLCLIIEAIREKMLNKKILLFSLAALVIHILSFFTSTLFYSLPFNYSWFIQGILLILLIPSGIVVIKNPDNFKEFKNIGKVFYWITLACGIFGAYQGISNDGINWILNGYSQEFSYSFVSSMDIGIIKQTYPFYLNLLFLLLWKDLPKKKLIPLLIVDFLLLLLFGSRTILFSMVIILIVIAINTTIKNLNKRKIVLGSFGLSFLVFFYIFKEEIYQITTSSGRFIFQLFTSETFWTRPFGVGLGNFTKSVDLGVWDNIKIDNLSSQTIVRLLQNTDLATATSHSLFPIAESDLILIGVSFGFLVFLIWVWLGAKYIRKFLIINTPIGKPYHSSLLIFIFIFLSGFLNDYLSFLPTWLFLSIAINSIEYKNNNI